MAAKKEKFYSLSLLQAALDILWGNATTEGYVLMVPSKALGAKRPRIAGVDLNMMDTGKIYQVLERLGVAELHNFQTSNDLITICRVLKKQIDEAKFAEVYKDNETVALIKERDELRTKLAEMEAKIKELTGEAVPDASADVYDESETSTTTPADPLGSEDWHEPLDTTDSRASTVTQ